MKKLLVISIALMALAVSQAYAGSSTGCGFGTEIFKGQSGMIPNLLAATTNQTYTQTLGITTGTAGCSADDTVQLEQMREDFVAINYENLSNDMARGDGQYVTAMADLMGCASVQGDFARVTQEKYEVLFSAPSVDAKGFLGGLKSELSKDPVLSAGCNVS